MKTSISHRHASSCPRNARSTSIARAVDVDRRGSRRGPAARAGRARRHARTSSTSQDGQREQPRARPRRPAAVDARRSPRGRRPSTRPPRARAAASRGASSSLPRAAPRRPRGSSQPVEAQDRPRVGARRGASISCCARPRHDAASPQRRAAARRARTTWKQPSSPCGRPTPADVSSSGVNRRCRRARGGSSLHRGGLHDRAQRVRGASAAADDLAVVVVGDRQLEHDRAVVLLELLDRHLVGLVDERRARGTRAAPSSALAGRRDWMPCDAQQLADRVGRLGAAGEPVRGRAPRRARSSRARSARCSGRRSRSRGRRAASAGRRRRRARSGPSARRRG